MVSRGNLNLGGGAMNPNDVMIKAFLKELLADFLGSIVRNVNKVYSDASYDGELHTPPPPPPKKKKML